MSTGKFCWFDLMSTDVAAASAFYNGLFGWKMQAHSAEYQLINDADDKGLGGLMASKDNMPSAWLAYVTVDDMAAAAAKITEIGGCVFMRHTIPTVGEFAIYSDRQGATLAAIQLANESGEYPREKAKNHIGWSELHTPDPADALAFHQAIFNWKSESWGLDYLLVGDEHAAGIVRSRPGAPAYWLIYVNVQNADATAAKVAELGGKVISPPQDMGNIGRFAVFADPAGAVFAVMQSAPRG